MSVHPLAMETQVKWAVGASEPFAFDVLHAFVADCHGMAEFPQVRWSVVKKRVFCGSESGTYHEDPLSLFWWGQRGQRNADT